MTQGPPWKHIIKFALPVLAGSLLQQLYNTVDAVVVGNFAGEASLSAVGTTGSFAFLFLTLALGFSAGNGVIISQYYGANNEKEVRSNASTGILLLLGLGIIAAIIGVLVARPAYTYMVNVPEEYLDLTLKYFRIYAIGLIFQYGYNIFSSILRAVGDSAATLYFLLISSVINILLDLLFVAVFNWNVSGAAIATVISQAVSLIAAYVYMTKKYPIFRFKLREYTWNNSIAMKTIKLGFPITMQLAIISMGLTFIQRAVNSFGQTLTASFTVGNRIEMYLHLPCNAFQITMATYTGQNIGANKINRVKSGLRQTVMISLILTVMISLTVILLTKPISRLFGLSGQAEKYCLEYLPVVALINIILSMYIPLFGVFQGSNHSGIPTIVATAALGIRVFITYLFLSNDILGYRIFWWNGLFGFGVGFIISWIYYLSNRWERNATLISETLST